MQFNRSTETTLVREKEMVLPIGKFEKTRYLNAQNSNPSKDEIALIKSIVRPKELDNE